MGSQSRSFEEALAELEARVRRLQGEPLALEEALSLFEEGIEMVRVCHDHLDAEAPARLNAGAEDPTGGL